MNRLVVLSFLLLAACSPTPAPPATLAVSYKVRGLVYDGASLTYRNAQGGTEQAVIDVPAPADGAWEKSFSVTRGQFLYISAQNRGKNGSITCEIWLDGSKWRSSTSSAPYGIASCSGAAGN